MSDWYSLVHSTPGRVRIRVTNNRLFDETTASLRVYLRNQQGIEDVTTNPTCRSLIVTHDHRLDTESVLALLDRHAFNTIAAVPALPALPSPAQLEPGSWLPLGLSTLAVAFGIMESAVAPWLLAAANLPIFKRAFDSVMEKGTLNVDVLDAAATTVLGLQGQFQTAASMVWLVSLGDTIRDVTMRQSQRTLENLFDGQAQFAWLIREGKKTQVRVETLRAGDPVVIYPGELIPVDGTVLTGTATVDQKILTGESVPVEKGEGDSVFAATVVREGKLYVKTANVGNQTAAAKIVKLVQDAPLRETRMQNYAERFADRLVPLSFLGAGAAYAVTANPGYAAALLIVDYGTGIRVSAPTTVLSSMTKAARHGIFIKGGRFLENLAEIDTIVFDKTGTLTAGTPEVAEVIAYGPDISEADVLALAASSEERLTHPIAEAIVRTAKEMGLAIPERGSSEYRIGLGVEANINGSIVLVGCHRLMALKGISDAHAEKDVLKINGRAATPVYVARDGELIGLIVYEDPIRPESFDVIERLRAGGVQEIIMLTGDHPAVAARVAEQLGIRRYLADVLPEQKLQFVKSLQREGRTVAVVGDGINDSPALAQADVGIAVRGGADVARETADVALLEGNLYKIPEALEVARESVRLIHQNWNLILYPNTAAIALSLLGMIGPVGAMVISNGCAILATLNGLRPLFNSDQRPNHPPDRKLHRRTNKRVAHDILKSTSPVRRRPVRARVNGTARVPKRPQQEKHAFVAHPPGVVVNEHAAGHMIGDYPLDSFTRP